MMNLTEKIHSILQYPAVNDRLKAELRYALRVSSAAEGKYDRLLEDVCGSILEKLEQTGCIDHEMTAEAETRLADMVPAAKAYTLHMVSHAHIDMNWQWGYQETVNVTLDTFRTMLRLMEEYPAFTFSQSQASTYAICEEHDPVLFEAIQKRVKEGRWEVAASTWTEADKNLPSGESLSRHHLYTKAYMKEKFGLTSQQLQLDFEPDTFGHSAFVPEILNQGQVKYYYHCRGKELEYAYRYKAPSGAEVLCYQDPFFYNETIDPYFYEDLPLICQKRGIQVGLRVYGVGDHGGGPSRRDIELIGQIQQWPLAPTILFSTYAAFFKQLEQYRDRLPVMDSERNYIFTGCYSSQSEIKAGNRLCEDRLYTAETLSALSGVYADAPGSQRMFRNAWQKVLFNQFHDILPGSCVRDSRHHALGLYQEAMAFANSGLTAGMLALAETIDSSAFMGEADNLTRSEGAGVGFGSALSDFAIHTAAEYGRGKTRVLHVFNPTAFDRDEVTTLTVWDYEGNRSCLVCENTKGQPLPFAVKSDGQQYWGHTLLQLNVKVQVPAFGVATVVVKEGELTALPLHRPEIESINARVEYVRPLVLENRLIRAEFDASMCLISLIDKENNRELVREKAGYFEYFAESGRIHMPNAWSEGPAVRQENMNQLGKVYIADRDFATAVDQSISYELEYRDTKMTVTVTLPMDSSVLQYNVITDWRENGFHGQEIPTLRFRVPLAYSADTCWYDVPMGTVTRPALHHDVPARSFVYAPNGNAGGVAVLCDTQGAYRNEYDTLSVTLLRATSAPDHLPEVGMHHHRVGIGVLPACKQTVYKAAQSFIYPMPFASVCPHKGTFPCDGQWLRIDGKVIVSGVKAPEDAKGKELLIRFYSLSEETQRVTLRFHGQPTDACRVDTLEQSKEALQVEDHQVTLSVAPLSVEAVRVRF